MTSFFSSQLLKWHADHPRVLPWDNDIRDPYHVWISEIIMQQTRIEQGAPYYKKFIARFPDVQSLAQASIDDVLRCWQGLGYYSRARNLHKAAQHIVTEFHGNFPDTFAGLISLPGIGAYTAAAIASFAYGLPHPVVDGNVKRLVSRFSGIKIPVKDPALQDKIHSIVSSQIKRVSPGEFNQAIMNFGALVCKPKGALCDVCPLSKKCYAFHYKEVETIPLRSEKRINRERYFHFALIQYRGRVLLHRREAKDIWHGLYVPPLLERNSNRSPSKNQIQIFAGKITGQHQLSFVGSSSATQQTLSHQTIYGRFHHIRLVSPPKKLNSSYVWVNHKTQHEYGKPKMIVEMLESWF